MSARTTTPLTGPEVGMLEAWLDQTADPFTNTAVVRRLLATLRLRDRQLAQARRHEETAWTILAVDCDPPGNPGDFGNDPAADWPTDFPKEP